MIRIAPIQRGYPFAALLFLLTGGAAATQTGHGLRARVLSTPKSLNQFDLSRPLLILTQAMKETGHDSQATISLPLCVESGS